MSRCVDWASINLINFRHLPSYREIEVISVPVTMVITYVRTTFNTRIHLHVISMKFTTVEVDISKYTTTVPIACV